MRPVAALLVVLVPLALSCAGQPVIPPAPGIPVAIPIASASNVTPDVAPAATPPTLAPPPSVELPASLVGRGAGTSATSLVGGDADTLDILFGQFESPTEAIVRFDRRGGCAREVIGPWPTLARIVRGHDDAAGKRLTRAQTLTLAQGPELAKELASIVRVYAERGNLGEDKLAFSRDGKSVVMEASDEQLIASSDGGARWTYLDGRDLRMPSVSPDGRYAIVRTAGTTPALYTFDAPTRVKPLGGPFMNDAIFGASSSSVVLVRSDRAAGRTTKLCIERVELPASAAPKKLACFTTADSGSWHVATPSRDARLAVFALVGKGAAVRLSVRSLIDGSEQEGFDVPGSWEQFQWVDVMVNARGVVAYNQPVRSGPFGIPEHPDGKAVVLGAGVSRREISGARPLGWLNERELVTLDYAKVGDAHGCGLVRVVDVSRPN